jgi:hypothetical protein
MMFVINAGVTIGNLNIVPAEPGPPLKVVPYNEFPTSSRLAIGKAPSLFVPLDGFNGVKL